MSARHPLQDIKTFPSLVKYLRDELDWPIETDKFDDLTFDFSPEELGLKPQEAAKIRDIKQLRPLTNNQPWGIFFVSFEPKRLPVVALRKILGNLVIKKRTSANKAERAAWQLHDLLFVSAFGEGDDRQITLAHFSEGAQGHEIPTLKVLGWDELDTHLNLQHVDRQLHERLRWPEKPGDLDAWREQWSTAFVLRHRHVILTAQELAERLAALAQSIRYKVNQVLEIESERGPMRKLYAAFREALIHDLGEDAFADMYAQTITYGLFSAAVSRTAPDESMGNRTHVVPENLADMVPITNPFLREMLSTFLTVGGRKGKLDFDELGIQEVVEVLNSPDTNLTAVVRNFGDRRQGEDPVIHFYEDFLKQYDKQRKVERGVFYTPQPVVSYIVRSVHELLQTEFGLEDGLASTVTWGDMVKRNDGLTIAKGANADDPFVVILDPATGTATFLVEVIDVIHRTMTEKWKRQGMSSAQRQDAWNQYVPAQLLPRLYGYELMMAPYAIAHMKIGLKLGETGYRFQSDQRARIYLTNSLEPASDLAATTAANLFEALGHEAQAVNDVKRDQRFSVVIGNPPYSIFSANLSKAAKMLVEQYRYIAGERIRERGALKSEVILQDDYVKFLGFAQNVIRIAGLGVVGMITNANCYQNPVLRGLRYNLQREFQLIRVVDLGGQSKAGVDSDENVFDIDTGVGISILLLNPRTTRIRQITRLTGSRSLKYQELLAATSSTLCDTEFHPKPDQFLFKAFESSFGDEYDAGFPIDRAFAVTSIGIKTARDHLVLDLDKTSLAERIDCLRNPTLNAAQLREQFAISDNTQWKFRDALGEFRASYSDAHFAQVEARPFDRRWLYFHPSLVFNTRPTVNRHVYLRQNLCLLAMRRIRTENYAHFFVVNRIGMGEIISSADNCNFFPLYVYHDDRLTRSVSRESNFTREFSSAIRANMGAGASSLQPEDILHYAYAVFHSPTYRTRYVEFLKIDFPRLPLTGSMELFRELARLGGELVSLHFLEAPSLDTPRTRFIGHPKTEISRVAWANHTVWIDAPPCKKGGKQQPGSVGFQGVPEGVWNFHVGGYQVCEKWLKDRKGRVLSKDDVAHYQKIVVALAETIRLMGEIDEFIEEHGGWPGAFATTPPADQADDPGELPFP